MLKRIVFEKRLFLLPIVVVLAANVIAYGLAIYPLAASVAGGEQRATRAAAALKTAEREAASARATVTGKARAEEELAKFYRAVLPPDLSSAGRMMYLEVARLARQCDLRYERRTLEPETRRESSLEALRMTLTLEGGYEDIRRFIHQIETGEPFVVIDHVALEQGRDRDGALAVTLELSTFYRVATDGT